MFNLLIIGGTGFIGRSIYNYLLNNPVGKKFKKIYILSRKNKISFLKKNNRFQTIKIKTNITKTKSLPDTNLIIYLAKLKNSKLDIFAAQNISKILSKKKSKTKFLYVSSGAVYGYLNKKKNLNENYLEKNKRVKFKDSKKNDYALSKIKCEKIFLDLESKIFKVKIARCFTFVGKNLISDKFAIREFILSILNNKPITIKSNFRVYRSYMHEYIMSKYLIKILLKENLRYQIFNVGSEDKVDLKKIGKFLAKKFKLQFIDKKIINKNTDFYVPNISRLKKNFQFKNNQSSLDSILKTIKSLKNA